MIDKLVFLKSLKYLNAIYPTFKLDTNDEMVVTAWYEILSDFETEQFRSIIKDYCKNNVFAPNSPASIIEWEKERIMKNIDSGEKFEKLISRLRNNAYDLDKILDRYEKSGLIPEAKTIRELYSDFKLWFNDSSQLGFLKSKFIKTYTKYYIQEVEKNIGKYSVEIGSDEKLKLGE